VPGPGASPARGSPVGAVGGGFGPARAGSQRSHAGEPGLELLNEVPMHGLEELELYGRRFLKPDDHETYLEALYGDWRVPDPDYCPWEDSRAGIAKYPRAKVKKR